MKKIFYVSALHCLLLACGSQQDSLVSGEAAARLVSTDSSQGPILVVEPVKAECQLATDDPDHSKSYALYASLIPREGTFETKLSAWKAGVETVIAYNRFASSSPHSLVYGSVTGERGSKVMQLRGQSTYLNHANQRAVLHDAKIELRQVVHPDDGTRAAGAIFHAVKSITVDGGTGLPDGVSLTGSNCFSHSGFAAYSF